MPARSSRSPQGRARDRRPLRLEFQGLSDEARRLAAGVGKIEHVVLQMANALEDLFAGQPMLETEGAMFRPPPSTWADPKQAGGLRLGPARPRARPAVPRRRPDAGRGLRITGKSPAAVDYYDSAVVRFAGGASGVLSGAATLPKGRPVQIDLRIFGSEGMLLLDIERERLELRRRDGKDEVFRSSPGDGAYACEEPLSVLVDLCLGKQDRATARPASSGSARSRCSTRCTARRRAGRVRSRCEKEES